MDFSFLNNRIYLRLRTMLTTEKAASLPPERELAEQLKISRNTLRFALRKLEQEGLIRRQRKCGTHALPVQPQQEKKRFLHILSDVRPSPHIVAEIFAGVEEKALQSGYETDCCLRSVFDRMPSDEIAMLLRERSICGLVVYPSNFTGKEKLFFTLKACSLPVVLVYCQEDDPLRTGFAGIVNCQRQAWKRALEYLADSGHRRIVSLTSPGRYIRNVFKAAEYRALLRSIGLVPRNNPVLKCTPDDRSLKRALEPFFTDRKKFPDALLCYSDYWVPAVYRVLKTLKVQVPADVSVMGYCGALDSTFTNPEISSLAVEYRKIGVMAVEMLLDSGEWFNSEHKDPPAETAPFCLKIRESTKERKELP